MAAKKSKKTSLDNFRSWLEGVEEMQGDDWVPTGEQWKKIRDKIDSITNTKAVEAAPAPAPVQTYIPAPAPAPVPAYTSSLDFVAPPQMRPQAPTEMNPHAPMAKGQHQVKTPDIDTSTGDYNSSFE